jgi:Flp pilus assembly protein CpaB
MQRRWIIIGALALLVAGAVYLFFARLERKATVVVATRNLPAGTRLQETDVEAQVIHASGAQTGVYSDTATLIGRKLRSGRLQGDQLTRAAFAAHPSQAETLAPYERAVAVKVTDSQGVLGLLQPDDHVSVVMVAERDARARRVLEGLRVLKVSHDFVYQEPDQSGAAASGGPIPLGGESPSGGGARVSPTRREEEGIVLLAVPSHAPLKTQVQLPDTAGAVFTATAQIGAAEALALLDKLGGLHLVLEPQTAQPAAPTSGLELAWLFPTPEPVLTPTHPVAAGTVFTVTAPLTGTEDPAAAEREVGAPERAPEAARETP